ncbi:MAG: alpha-ketoacid dehydrogenase subunit beta [Planctomycetota bacterium]|nr:alpha-ketoacid dehydrogenase subunit beta [Planctomycetota bacterium]MCB9825764.1 alpha-ketoacid dehydrogenase subunit beta [Planctomycetota bacterium]
MPQMTMLQAINDAMHVAMERDPDVVMLGEDIGKKGGVFGATDGLYDKFGALRVMDTPLSECGIIGTAVGMALYGLKPVPEIQFLDFIYPAFDQIVSEMAKMRYRSGGQFTCPMVVRSPSGGGIRGGHYHSQSSEAYFAHTPGLRVVMPSTPADAKGMLLASIFNEDPVIFLEPKALYRHGKQEVQEGWYTTSLDEARRVREGDDVTVVTWGAMVPIVEDAAGTAAENGVACDVIDLRSILPWDYDTVLDSVRKTGRLVVVQEAPRTCGFASEVAATVAEKAIDSLEAPIARVTGFDTPFPYALEHVYKPDKKRVLGAIEFTARWA